MNSGCAKTDRVVDVMNMMVKPGEPAGGDKETVEADAVVVGGSSVCKIVSKCSSV